MHHVHLKNHIFFLDLSNNDENSSIHILTTRIYSMNSESLLRSRFQPLTHTKRSFIWRMFIRIAAAAIGKKNRTNWKNKMYHSAHFERETFSFFLNRTIMIRIFKDVICLHFKENAVWKHFFLLLLSCVFLFLLLLLTVDRNSGQVFAFTRRGPRDCFDYTLLSTSDQWDGHENVCGHTHTHTPILCCRHCSLSSNVILSVDRNENSKRLKVTSRNDFMSSIRIVYGYGFCCCCCCSNWSMGSNIISISFGRVLFLFCCFHLI